MSVRGERYVVLSLAGVRSHWVRDVARWATSGSIPVEMVTCVSTEEVHAHLTGSRPFSALLFDAAMPGATRDLTDDARTAGVAPIAIAGHGPASPDLGPVVTLAPDFSHVDLIDALAEHATMVARGSDGVADPTGGDQPVPGWKGQLVAVTGSGGSGASTVAMAVAQGFGADVSNAGLVLLADLALRADLAMLHDSGDIVPGVPEMADLFRGGRPTNEQIRGLTYTPHRRGYGLLLGLRRPRDWAAVRPRALVAMLDGLTRSYRVVVGDITADFDGERETGSVDVEERNAMARHTARSADIVLVVGTPGVKGIHGVVRTTTDLVGIGVSPAAILPVINHAPRSPRQRAQICRALADLAMGGDAATAVAASPLFVPTNRKVESAIGSAAPLPAGFVEPLSRSVTAHLDRPLTIDEPRDVPGEPEAIAPGSLGPIVDFPEEEAS